MIRLKGLLLEDYDPAQDKELWEMSEAEFKDLIKSYESLRLTAYKLGDGKITVGWGHAEDTGSSKYKLGQTISKEEAINLFNTDYAKEKNAIASYIPNWSKLPTYIKFALINTKFRGEFKTGYKWAQGIINDDWSDVAKNYSEGWGWPIPGGKYGTVAHRMTKNYNAFKKYAEGETATSDTEVITGKPYVSPNPAPIGTRMVTIHYKTNSSIDEIHFILKDYLANQIESRSMKRTETEYTTLANAGNHTFNYKLPDGLKAGIYYFSFVVNGKLDILHTAKFIYRDF